MIIFFTCTVLARKWNIWSGCYKDWKSCCQSFKVISVYPNLGDFTFRYNLKQFMSFVGLEDSLKIGCYLGNLYNKTGYKSHKNVFKDVGSLSNQP